MNDNTAAQVPVRGWDPNRPILAGLLARREELLAAYVNLADGVARFTSQAPEPTMHARAQALPPGIAQSALATLATIPRQVVEPFDLGALLAEQLSDTEQVLAGLRDDPVTYEVPVRTWVQPLAPMVMPDEGIYVNLLIQIKRQPLRAVMVMPVTAIADETEGDGAGKSRLGWTSGRMAPGSTEWWSSTTP